MCPARLSHPLWVFRPPRLPLLCWDGGEAHLKDPPPQMWWGVHYSLLQHSSGGALGTSHANKAPLESRKKNKH